MLNILSRVTDLESGRPCILSRSILSISLQPYGLQYSSLENPMTEEPGRLQSMGSLRVGHDNKKDGTEESVHRAAMETQT